MTPAMGPDLMPLFDTILNFIPGPTVEPDAPLQLLVTNLGYDEYRGVTAVGRIFAGTMKSGQTIARIVADGSIKMDKIPYLYVFKGLEKVEVDEVKAGDIVAVAGLEEIVIGDTIADPINPVALPRISVEEPTVRMTFGVNTSPFTGREGKWGTSRKIRERLFDELRKDVALRVAETESADTFLVSGRGELHLAILIENMRREGYEFQVSKPEAILKKGENGEVLEPFEELSITTSQDTVGVVVEMLGVRRGQMEELVNATESTVYMRYIGSDPRITGFPLPVPDSHTR